MSKYGLIGGKLSHSFSKGIHERYFNHFSEVSTYELIEVSAENLGNTLPKLSNENYCGINVTIPHKKAVMEYMDEISEEAITIGAVNTIKFVNGKMYGYNTDYFGFGASLDYFDVSINNKNVYILGTGGAANAVSAYCKDNGGNVIFVSRNPSGNAIGYEEIKKAEKGSVLINCTPVGMYPNTDNTPTDFVEAFESVVDLIYNPSKTKLLQNAEQHGIKTVNGLYMLVAQAIYAQAIWHGNECDKALINSIYNDMQEGK